ncbi:hypothetical protein [Actinoplanes solisilvae]|uniref:hypothetical protein n=1 Tax=Actinoplanes solisilvae TaxID=2486853 RepID=UPI000FDB2D6A|nr:hypothetical protein [Actinoplanes solisilvae]
MSQGPRRLSAHRMALALALVSAGPPLVVHNGWRGLVLAVIGAAYAAYLLLGKRWPRLRRPAGRRPAQSGVAAPARPASRLVFEQPGASAEPEQAAAEHPALPVVFEHPAASVESGRADLPVASGRPAPPVVFENPDAPGHPDLPPVSRRPATPVVFEQPEASSQPDPSVHSEPSPQPNPAARSESWTAPQPAPRFRHEQPGERDN